MSWHRWILILRSRKNHLTEQLSIDPSRIAHLKSYGSEA
jgi:hypothetical protein